MVLLNGQNLTVISEHCGHSAKILGYGYCSTCPISLGLLSLTVTYDTTIQQYSAAPKKTLGAHLLTKISGGRGLAKYFKYIIRDFLSVQEMSLSFDRYRWLILNVFDF